MSFNPLQETGIPLEVQLRSWRELDEAVMFSHQMARNTLDSAVKKRLALLRRI